jgi:hypothetical protein
MSARRARRREARRTRRLARFDVGVGVGCGLLLIIFTPGLAIAAVLAALAVLLCVGSVVIRPFMSRRLMRRRLRP